MDTKSGLKTAVTVTFARIMEQKPKKGQKEERFLAMNHSWKNET